jgi:hypothetical protein
MDEFLHPQQQHHSNNNNETSAAMVPKIYESIRLAIVEPMSTSVGIPSRAVKVKKLARSSKRT